MEKLLQLYVEKLEDDEIKNGNNLINCKPISEYIKIKEEEWEINKSSDITWINNFTESIGILQNLN